MEILFRLGVTGGPATEKSLQAVINLSGLAAEKQLMSAAAADKYGAQAVKAAQNLDKQTQATAATVRETENFSKSLSASRVAARGALGGVQALSEGVRAQARAFHEGQNAAKAYGKSISEIVAARSFANSLGESTRDNTTSLTAFSQISKSAAAADLQKTLGMNTAPLTEQQVAAYAIFQARVEALGRAQAGQAQQTKLAADASKALYQADLELATAQKALTDSLKAQQIAEVTTALEAQAQALRAAGEGVALYRANLAQASAQQSLGLAVTPISQGALANPLDASKAPVTRAQALAEQAAAASAATAAERELAAAQDAVYLSLLKTRDETIALVAAQRAEAEAAKAAATAALAASFARQLRQQGPGLQDQRIAAEKAEVTEQEALEKALATTARAAEGASKSLTGLAEQRAANGQVNDARAINADAEALGKYAAALRVAQEQAAQGKITPEQVRNAALIPPQVGAGAAATGTSAALTRATTKALAPADTKASGFANLTAQLGLVAPAMGRVGQSATELAAKERAAGAAAAGMNKTIGNFYPLIVATGIFHELARAAFGFAGASIKTAADYETSFAAVARTTTTKGGDAALQVDNIRKALTALSTQVPVSFQDLAKIATLGNQLGLAGADIPRFTEIVAKFSAVTGESAEQTARSFGTLIKVLHLSNSEFGNVASSVTLVGRKSLATEPEVLAMTTKLAAIATVAGFTAQQTIGLGAALSSLKEPVERSQGALVTYTKVVDKAASEGGPKFQKFAELIGRSASASQALLRQHPYQFFKEVLDGLSKMDAISRTSKLGELGLGNIRVSEVLTRLSDNMGIVNDTQKDAAQGFASGTDLTNQYAKATDTLAAKFKELQNAVANLFAAIGANPLTAQLAKIVEFLRDVAVGLATFAGANPKWTAFAVGVALVVGVMATARAAMYATAIAAFALDNAFGRVGAKETFSNIQKIINVLTGVRTATVATTAVKDADTVATEANAAALQSSAVAVEANAAARKAAALATEASAVAKGADTVSTEANAAAQSASAAATGTNAAATTALAGAQREATVASGLLATGLGLVKAASFAVGFGIVIAAVTALVSSFQQAQDDLKSGFSATDLSAAMKKDTQTYNDTGKAIRSIGMEQEVSTTKAAGWVKGLNDASHAQADLNKNTTATTKSMDEQTVRFGAASKSALQYQLVNNTTYQNMFKNRKGLNLVTKDLGFDVSTFADKLTTQGEKAGNAYLFGYLNTLRKRRNPTQNTLIEISTLQDLVGVSREVAQVTHDAAALTAADASVYGEHKNKVKSDTDALVTNEAATAKAAAAHAALSSILSNQIASSFGGANAIFAESAALGQMGQDFANIGPNAAFTGQAMQQYIQALGQVPGANEQSVADGLRAMENGFVNAGLAANVFVPEFAAVNNVIDNFGGSTTTKVANVKEFLIGQRDAIKAQIAANSGGGGGGGLAGGASKASKALDAEVKSAQAAAKAAHALADKASEAAAAFRTTADYASDLGNVLSRAFDLQFGPQTASDAITQSFNDLHKNADDAVKSIKDARTQIQGINADIEKLQADNTQKNYFLGIASAFGDRVGAASLQADIATNNASIRDKQNSKGDQYKAIGDAQATLDTATSGNGDTALRNRGILTDLVGKYKDYIDSLAASGLNQKELNAKIKDANDNFLAQGQSLGFSTEQLKPYTNAMKGFSDIVKKVPRKVTVGISANASPAQNALREFFTKLKLDSNVKSAEAAAKIKDNFVQKLQDSAAKAKDKMNQQFNKVGNGMNAALEKRLKELQKQIDDFNNKNKNKGGVKIGGIHFEANTGVLNARIAADLGRIRALSIAIKSLGNSDVADALHYANDLARARAKLDADERAKRNAGRDFFASGGYTGPGQKYQPAGIVHKGEYVVPKHLVNQQTGLPNSDALGRLIRGTQVRSGYASGGYVNPDVMVVEPGPKFMRKLQEIVQTEVTAIIEPRSIAGASKDYTESQRRRGSVR